MSYNKNKKDTKETLIRFRISEAQKNEVQTRANIYSNGNISEWIRYCLSNPNPKILKKARSTKP